MEFPVYLSKVLPTDSNGFAILDAAALNPRSGMNSTLPGRFQSYKGFEGNKDILVQIIDRMGEASSIVRDSKSCDFNVR